MDDRIYGKLQTGNNKIIPAFSAVFFEFVVSKKLSTDHCHVNNVISAFQRLSKRLRRNVDIRRTEVEVQGLYFPYGKVNWLFNVTINDISVIYVTAHRCAGGLKKKLDLRSGSQRHRHFAGFFNVPVLVPTRDQPFYTVIPTHRPI